MDPMGTTTEQPGDDLATWLRAQLDHVERTALAAKGDGPGRWRPVEGWDGAVQDTDGCTIVYDEGLPTVDQAQHIALHDPATVLADVAAKRAVLDWLDKVDRWVLDTGIWGDPGTDQPRRDMAATFADRPGYREEWRP